MKDFDDRLRARLQHLDAAIPAPRPPSSQTLDARPVDAAAARTSRQMRRRKAVVLLVAAVFLTAASVATAERILYPDLPEPALEAAVAEVFAQSDCLTATDARQAIKRRLDEMGYVQWAIEARPGAEDVSCVSAFLVIPHHAVVLIPGISPDVANAMEDVADELMHQCLGRADAMQLVSSALSSAGETDFVVRADPFGPRGAPVDRLEEYRDHVAAGCFVYVGMPTRDADGKAVHDLWGP